MNFVEPIRDLEKIRIIHEDLMKQNPRDALLFSFGIYTGLRISDILKFKVKDVSRNAYNIREKKTKKQKAYDFNSHLKKEINVYIANKEANEYLFKSREGNRPITRQRAYQIIRKACNNNKIYNVGTHTLRKTFGYHAYKDKKDVALLMDIFNHSNESITLRYIGINQETGNEVIKKLKYF